MIFCRGYCPAMRFRDQLRIGGLLRTAQILEDLQVVGSFAKIADLQGLLPCYSSCGLDQCPKFRTLER